MDPQYEERAELQRLRTMASTVSPFSLYFKAVIYSSLACLLQHPLTDLCLDQGLQCALCLDQGLQCPNFFSGFS